MAGLAVALDAPGFFADTVPDLDDRRVCGVGPIYTMLRALPSAARASPPSPRASTEW